MDKKLHKKFLKAQENEITEFHIYKNLALKTSNKSTKNILIKIANEERAHYEKWLAITRKKINPSAVKIRAYLLLSGIFGLSFSLRLMERGEELSQKIYGDFKNNPEVLEVIKEEQKHEEALLGLIDDNRLKYVSSFVLGLNDALVELTGALAGLTLALSNTRIIAMVGLITGIAASFSMAASSYLAAKEENSKHAIKSGIITGISYITTVSVLILPYLLEKNAFIALGTTLLIAICVIALFTFYTSVAKSASFKKNFLHMSVISLGVAVINFGIGFAVKNIFGIDA